MAYKALIFGVDDMFAKLQPYYAQAIQRGILEIVAYAVIEPNGIRLVTPDGKRGAGQLRDVQLAIISSRRFLYDRMKFLEAKGFPRNRIIDGRVFQVQNFDFNRLVNEGVIYGVLDSKSFKANSHVRYPQVYKFKDNPSLISFGTKGYISTNAAIDGKGVISVGNFSSVSWNITFVLARNDSHNYRNISTFPLSSADWDFPIEFFSPRGVCKILIGNDVWIGRGSILKCTNPNKPLIIGDGAVVASDSVVVKSVPPYAIVGGNPAKIIKYRFEPHVIEAFQRIKWWDWSIDKIHDNFKYFNDIDKFIALHDKT